MGIRRQQVLALAQVVRIGARRLKARQCLLRLPCIQGGSPEGEVCGGVLSGDPARSSLPRIEAPRGEVVQCLVGLVSLVVQRREFDGEVVALPDQVKALLQPRQTLPGRHASPAQQLIQFREHSSVLRVDLECLFVAGNGPVDLVAHVIVGDAQVPPGNRKPGLQPDGHFPVSDRLVIASLVVEQVAQVVGDPGILRVNGSGVLQDRSLFEPYWETVVCGHLGGPAVQSLRLLLLPLPEGRVAQCVQHHRIDSCFVVL